MDNPNFLDTRSINGLNLFAYCNNNPVMIVDDDGRAPEWWQWLLSGAAVIGGIASGLVAGGTEAAYDLISYVISVILNYF